MVFKKKNKTKQTNKQTKTLGDFRHHERVTKNSSHSRKCFAVIRPAEEQAHGVAEDSVLTAVQTASADPTLMEGHEGRTEKGLWKLKLQFKIRSDFNLFTCTDGQATDSVNTERRRGVGGGPIKLYLCVRSAL